MELKKSYKGFLLWMLAFIVCMFGVCFIPGMNGDLATRLVFNLCTVGMTILCYIMYKTEYVYWINGTTYEQAVKAGSERRKEFALKHMKVFGNFAILFLVLSIIFHIFDVQIWVDILIGTIGIIVTAVRTIPFKL